MLNDKRKYFSFVHFYHIVYTGFCFKLNNSTLPKFPFCFCSFNIFVVSCVICIWLYVMIKMEQNWNMHIIFLTWNKKALQNRLLLDLTTKPKVFISYQHGQEFFKLLFVIFLVCVGSTIGHDLDLNHNLWHW